MWAVEKLKDIRNHTDFCVFLFLLFWPETLFQSDDNKADDQVVMFFWTGIEEEKGGTETHQWSEKWIESRALLSSL